jgi:hypothetical protein
MGQMGATTDPDNSPKRAGYRDEPRRRHDVRLGERSVTAHPSCHIVRRMEFEAIAIRGPCCSIRYTSRPRTFSCNSISCNSSRARSRPARPLLGLFERSFSMRRSAASTRSRARSRSNRVYRRGSDSIRFFRGDARSPNGRRMSLRPTPVDFFAISSSLIAFKDAVAQMVLSQ